MSGIVWKHEAPRLCRIRRALFGASPSAIFSCCALGLRHGCRACKGCEHNVAEIMLEGFEEGARRAQELKESALEKLKEMNLPEQVEILAVDALDELKDAPRSCRSNCAAAKARGSKETEYVTGCEWCLPLQEECPECPHWSESRYFAAIGKLIGKGFAAGMGHQGERETTK